MQPSYTTTIICSTCGGNIKGGERDYIVHCPYCGAEYQLSVSIVAVSPADVEGRISALTDCVISGNPRERNEAVLELAKYNDARVVQPVIKAIKALSARYEEWRELDPALQQLKAIITGIRAPEAVTPLCVALDDDSAGIRQLAARALELLEHPAALEPLLAHVDDSDNYVRAAISGALGSINDPRAEKALLRRIASESDYGALRTTARALGRLRSKNAVPYLERILADTTRAEIAENVYWSEVRMWAAHALGDIGDAAAEAVLRAAADDSNNRVADAARAGFGKSYTLNRRTNVRISSDMRTSASEAVVISLTI
jgi:HEAT repeat protein